MDVILNISNWFEKVKAIKFHGKPVKTEPLINSTILKIKENIKTKEKIKKTKSKKKVRTLWVRRKKKS